LGVHKGEALVHVGRVGTGFTHAVAGDLWRELESTKRPAAPFARSLPRETAAGVHWVEPRLVAEVELRGWTADGLLRHASFKGLREDKDLREVVRETKLAREVRANKRSPREPLQALSLTHPDRVLWPDTGLTKQGLAEFYTEIAEWVLPHIVGRPLSLVRCPSGTGEACFFQKHAWKGMSDAIGRKTVACDEMLFIEDLDGLVALVQSGVLEIHPWGSTLRAIEKPDRITMDLDPAEDVPWTALIECALEVRERLGALGLESFVNTTGGKGLHVVVPLKPKAGWDEVKAFAQGIATAMAGDSPSRYVATMAKQARKGRIFIDYLRNGRGATAIAAYSTRAREGAPVSTPLAWSELSASLRPSHFTVENLPRRLSHLNRGPWAHLVRVEQALPSVKRTRRSR
jgi:bifunctional non-homologous end joining protein LigD